MEVKIVKKIVSTIHDSPKSINQIAEVVDIGWKTCEKYLEGLKLLGIVKETRTRRERVFAFRERRRGWLYPHSRRIIGNKVERSDEMPPASGVESLE